MSNLYYITEELLSIEREIEENNGEITPEIEERLNISQEDFHNKMGDYCRFIKITEGRIIGAEQELIRISSYINRKKTMIERLKSSMVAAIKLFGHKDSKSEIYRYELESFNLSTRKSESVEILDEKIIDEKFKKFEIKLNSYQKQRLLEMFDKDLTEGSFKESVSKTEIKEHIKSGNQVDGAKISTNFSIQIK